MFDNAQEHLQSIKEQSKNTDEINKPSEPKTEDDEEEVTFVFTNLDTGESNLININETSQLERSCSFKKKGNTYLT